MSSRNIFLSLIIITSQTWGFTTITSSVVHERLVRGDSLILLDVREVYEYQRGHIAEPAGQLPLTPANMPWNSSVLTQAYNRLPKGVDILVYCASGARSAAASAFLDSKGFTRIYNMSGGFNSWTYESRKAGFGDHSGKWVRPADLYTTTITCSSTDDTCSLYFPPGSLAGSDSLYFEIHHADHTAFVPPSTTPSDLAGLFRITALDRFGLPAWSADSLELATPAELTLIPEYRAGQKPESFSDLSLAAFFPAQGWRPLPFRLNGLAFSRSEHRLKKWYNLIGFSVTAVALRQANGSPSPIAFYPNPFNGALRIEAPGDADILVYDLAGRFVDKIRTGIWQPPASTPSGIYFIHIRQNRRITTKRVTLIK